MGQLGGSAAPGPRLGGLSWTHSGTCSQLPGPPGPLTQAGRGLSRGRQAAVQEREQAHGFARPGLRTATVTSPSFIWLKQVIRAAQVASKGERTPPRRAGSRYGVPLQGVQVLGREDKQGQDLRCPLRFYGEPRWHSRASQRPQGMSAASKEP